MDSSSPLPSPSCLRAASAGNGLSELSKQLRILQAQNQSQSVEIDRLERQLRILADLQGISVADLRQALQEACEAEAHGELSHRVASLRAQLEAASVAKQRGVEDAVAAKKIANLELRVGELLEVEEAKQKEISGLYQQLKDQKGTAVRFETLYKQQMAEKEQLIEERGRSSTVVSEQENPADAPLVVTSQMIEAEAELKVLRASLKISENQCQAAEKQSKLRKSQFDARFMVQDENIKDLEQQLSSLYVAFHMMQEDHEHEREKRLALQANLGEADAEIARQVNTFAEQQDPTPSSICSKIRKSPSTKNDETNHPSIEQSSSNNSLVLSGTLLIRTSGLVKTWKKREVSLFCTMMHHRLDIGDNTTVGLEFGVSKVEPHNKHPLGFAIYTNPARSNTIVLHAAATNPADLKSWMTALLAATTGEEYLDGDTSYSESSSYTVHPNAPDTSYS